MLEPELVGESVWNTYRSMAHIISEVEDPKHWRSWPLDPKNPEKGRLAAQKASSQSKHGHGGNEGFVPLSSRTRRTRVTTPASKEFAGAKGNVVRHTTAQRARDAFARGPLAEPSAIEKRTDVTANVTPGKPGGQRKIKNFPDKHSTDTKDPQAPKKKKMRESKETSAYRTIGSTTMERHRKYKEEQALKKRLSLKLKDPQAPKRSKA